MIILKKLENIKNNARKLFYDLKDKLNSDFNNPRIQKRLVIISSVILLTLLLIVGIYNSFAFYEDIDDGVSLIKAEVGELYVNNYDYTLLVYLNDGDGNYRLVSDIPSSGYNFKEYFCLKGSTFEYNDRTKMTKATLGVKDVCSVYFDRVG